ncbi:MAG: TIGR04282 family arsenosugar biosynthesis glycosyltransferase [Gammaproteobacteria bacterium]
MDSTLILFAKAPVPGQVKTRLIPYLGAERACALHMHLVRCAIETVKGSRIKHIELWCTPDVDHPFFIACRDRYGVSLHRQRGIDLGSRMAGALSKVLERARSALLIGSDCPALSADDLDAGARALSKGYDAVLGPAADGGYVLIGLKRVATELFTGIPWGTAQVGDMTRNRMKALGLRCWELPVRPDVDRPADLAGLGFGPGERWP